MEKEVSSMVSVDEDKIGLSLEYVKSIISKNDNFIILDINEVDESKATKGALKEIELKLQYLSVLDEDDEKKVLDIKIQLMPMEEFSDLIDSTLTKISIDENDIANAVKKDTVIVVETLFQNDPLEDYQVQLKLLNLMTPKSILFSDVSACSARSGRWMRYNANFDLLSSLEHLYNVHAVYDKDDMASRYWFHTHGLNRLSLPEVEVIGIADENIAYSAGALINTVAKLLIENNMPDDATIFTPAYDVEVTLKPFKDAKQYFDAGTLGTDEDDRGDSHSNEAVVVIPMKKNKVVTYKDYEKELTDNPIFIFSNFETSLIQEAARHTIGYFTGIFKTQKNNDDYRFIVKLGYLYNQGTDDEGQEHLWFDIEDIDEENMIFDATLLNRPYNDVGLKEGERGKHDFDKLTDWQITTKDHSYSSTNIYLLLNVM